MQSNKDFSRDEKKKNRISIDAGFCLHNSLVKSVVGQTYDRVSFLQSACMGKYPCPDNPVRCGERGRAFCIPLVLLDRVHPQTEDGVSVPLFAHASLGF